VYKTQLQCRPGKESKIPVTPIVEKLHLLRQVEGVVRGQTYDKAQCIVQLTANPSGDGRVRLELTPQIEHGEPRNRPVGQQGLWRIDTARDRVELEDLRMHILLAPGQTAVLTCSEQATGVGGTFFAGEGTGPAERLVMLLRVAQTQHDELFEPTSDQ